LLSAYRYFPGNQMQKYSNKSVLGIILVIILTVKLLADDNQYQYSHGGIIRADLSKKEIALIFTGGDFADGGDFIRETLLAKKVTASFFFTGDFYRKPQFKSLIGMLCKDGHYLGPHSDKHLLYCDWKNRDSLLVTKDQFRHDLLANYAEMEKFGLTQENCPYFMPPYEWYNDSISVWAEEIGLTLVNFTPGTLSNADYTIPSMRNYQSSEIIYDSIVKFEDSDRHGMNGFLLLIHIGTAPERTDKFYHRLDDLIDYLHDKGYSFKRIDDLLMKDN